MWFAVDLDGTVAEIDHRLKYILNLETGERLPRKERNYDKFFANCLDDNPMFYNIDFIKEMAARLFVGKFVYVTGRPEKMRKDSLEWINKYVDPEATHFELFMRPEGDYRPDHVVKPELLEQVIKIERGVPARIFDDRDGVLKAYEKIVDPATIIDIKKIR